MVNSKNLQIILLQTIGIILVVLGHSIPEDVIIKNNVSVIIIRNFIYSFHMALFFAIAGFLYIYTKSYMREYSSFILNKAKRLFIPYILLGLIVYIPHYILNRHSSNHLSLDFLSVIKSFIYPETHTIRFYWFIPVLFFLFMIAKILMKFLEDNKKSFVFCFLLMLVFLNIFRPLPYKILGINILQVFAIYFVIGQVISIYKNIFLKLLTRNIIIGLITIIFITSHIYFWYMPPQNIYLYHLLELSLGLSGILLMWKITLNFNHLNKIINFISKYSYQVFLLSIFPQVLIKLGYNFGYINYWGAILLMFTLGLIIPLLFVKLVNKYLPNMKFIIGMR